MLEELGEDNLEEVEECLIFSLEVLEFQML